MNNSKIVKALYYILGMLSLGMGFIGFVTPGIPFSIFIVFSAWCFAKSSDRMHNWLYSHKHFGPFLTNWSEHRVFPTRLKYVMISTMILTLVITYHATQNLNAVLWSGGFMLVVAIWAWRYPGSIEEAKKKKST